MLLRLIHLISGTTGLLFSGHVVFAVTGSSAVLGSLMRKFTILLLLVVVVVLAA